MENNREIGVWMKVVSDLAEMRSGVDVSELLSVSFGRVVHAEARRLGRFDQTLYSTGELNHIIDWLVAARLRNEEWLTRVDANGRPLKLMKFGSIAQMTAEANKAMKKRRGDGAALRSTEGVELVHDCGDGFGIFRLTTDASLDREGFEMGHCLGQGSYDQGVADGSTVIYSLRDRFGKSHATIDCYGPHNRVRQIKGKQNDHPKPEYFRKILAWLPSGWSVDDEELPPGFPLNRQGRPVDLAGMKPGEVFHGDLLFRSSYATDEEPDEFPIPLPDGIVVNGNIEVVGADLISRMRNGKGSETSVLQRLVVPKGLRVEGRLVVKYMHIDVGVLDVDHFDAYVCHVDRLPSTFRAEANFRNAAFDGLAETTFEGNVMFSNCSSVKLGRGVRFGADVLTTGCSKIGLYSPPAVIFENGTIFGGHLRVETSDVGFKGQIDCGGNVTIQGSHEICMPESFKVGGDLVIDDVVMDKWPQTLDVGGTITVTDYNLHSGEAYGSDGVIRPAQAVKFG
jgi:hypothetical protein